MSEHDELLELAELYATGGLSPADRARLAEHVADGCRECEAALGSAARLADELLLAVPPVQPSPGVRVRLMDRVRSESSEVAVPSAVPLATVRRAPARRRTSFRPSFAAAAGVLLTVGLASLSGVLASRLARESAARTDLESALDYQETISWSMARDLERERSERVSLENRITNMTRIVQSIEAPVRTVVLAGQGHFQNAMAKAYIEPGSGRLIVYAHNLPPVPDGRTYQLWVIIDKRPPINAGLLQANAKGEAKYDTGPLENLTGPVTVAVTLEPAGGVPAPTGPLVLAEG